MDSREIDYEVYGDDDSDPVQAARIAKYGIVKKTIKAFGCTSRKQARRLAKAIVFSEGTRIGNSNLYNFIRCWSNRKTWKCYICS